MLYYEIEKFFETETTEKLLEEYEPIFKDITNLEGKLLTRKITTVKDIDDNLGIATVLENKCLEVYVIADTFKTGEESRLKNKIINNAIKAKTKVNVSQAKEQASCEVQYLRRVRNLFQMYKDRALNIKIKLKASLYNNAGYTSEDKERQS